jgi:hypothetical protein
VLPSAAGAISWKPLRFSSRTLTKSKPELRLDEPFVIPDATPLNGRLNRQPRERRPIGVEMADVESFSKVATVQDIAQVVLAVDEDWAGIDAFYGAGLPVKRYTPVPVKLGNLRMPHPLTNRRPVAPAKIQRLGVPLDW